MVFHIFHFSITINRREKNAIDAKYIENNISKTQEVLLYHSGLINKRYYKMVK